MSLQDPIEMITSQETVVVSFDVFDSLLVRPCQPDTILKLVALKTQVPFEILKVMRWMGDGWWQDIEGIKEYGIYDEYNRANLKNEEIMMEELLLQPRPIFKELFELALKNNKIIILASDMYLPEDTIIHLLNIKGYDTSKIYKTYISTRTESKKNKKTFKKIIKDFLPLGIHPENILHIGNNVDADFISPIECGMRACYIPSPISNFKLTELGNSIKIKTIGDELEFGYIANRLFDDPTIEYEGITNGSHKIFNYVLGVILFNFTIWVLKKSRSMNIDKILYLNNDGSIFKSIADTLIQRNVCSNLSIEPFYFNRVVRIPDCLLNDGIIPKKLVKYLRLEYFNDDFSKKDLNKLTDAIEVFGYTDQNINALVSNLDSKKLFKMHSALSTYIQHVCKDNHNIAILDGGSTASALQHIWRFYPESNIQYEFQLRGLNPLDKVLDYTNENVFSMDWILNTIDPKVNEIENKDGQFKIKTNGDYKIWFGPCYLQLITMNVVNEMLDLYKNILQYMEFSSECFNNVFNTLALSKNTKDKKILKNYSRYQIEAFDLIDFEKLLKNNIQQNPKYNMMLLKLESNIKQNNTSLEEILAYYNESKKMGYVESDSLMFQILLKNGYPLDAILKEIKKSASSGNISSIVTIAEAYRNGYGVEKNLIEAKNWMKLVTTYGTPKQVSDYIQLLYDLNNAEYDKEAFTIVNDDQFSNNPIILKYLIKAYKHGKGTDVDLKKAIEIMEPFSTKKIQWLESELIDTLWIINDPEYDKKMIKLAKRYAKTNNVDAMVLLSNAYCCGRGVNIDLDQSHYWANKTKEINPKIEKQRFLCETKSELNS